MLRPDFLPGYLLMELTEMHFEDCKILEYPDHQVVGIKPVLKLLKFRDKNSCVAFLGS